MVTSPNQIVAQEEGVPSYAKWGKLAMQETKKRYSNAEIIDYLYIGKESQGENSVEKFKLWLKKEDREFGVYIDITFHSETEEVISIEFEETDR
ncbi:DUF3889 domain-containing protein [Oceanobacillus halophilus]|uniref:DUF3889 domain-containing protein n=2 Tax=Oceanobacillus halophilus TaxID=930130 RepID=A0A495A0V3_9BACI|nr:DUF3889 domain-containing protein [Oceanobacillus halophilus]